MVGLEKDFNEEMIEGYYKNEKYCADAEKGVDREGLFKVLCNINSIEVPDDQFVHEAPKPEAAGEAGEAEEWKPEFTKMKAFDTAEPEA